jgi:putative flippase GtrA
MSKLGKTTRPKKLTSRRPWRFTVVGVINTVIDFLI